MDLLAPGFRVFAPDSHDAGNSPRWPPDQAFHLADESALIEPIIRKSRFITGAGRSFLWCRGCADRGPGEPPLFSLLDAERPAPNDADGIRNAIAEAGAALDAGDQDAAAERFIDYWMGAGAWKQTPEPRKPPIFASVTNVRRWALALFNEPAPLAAFRRLDIPVLYMTGKRSTR